MKVTKGLKNAHSSYPTILTLGTFDGIHQGHKTIISKLTGESKKNNLKINLSPTQVLKNLLSY